MPHATNDRLIHAAIKDGKVRVDAETGHVEINGWRARGQRSGYLTVTAKGQSVLAHRVMWIYHYPQTPETLQVNHRNGRRWDNRLSNLELVTPTDNVRHAVGREYAAVNDLDESDSVLDSDWLATVMALAARGDATVDEIHALKRLTPINDSDPQPFASRRLSRSIHT